MVDLSSEGRRESVIAPLQHRLQVLHEKQWREREEKTPLVSTPHFTHVYVHIPPVSACFCGRGLLTAPSPAQATQRTGPCRVASREVRRSRKESETGEERKRDPRARERRKARRQGATKNEHEKRMRRHQVSSGIFSVANHGRETHNLHTQVQVTARWHHRHALHTTTFTSQGFFFSFARAPPLASLATCLPESFARMCTQCVQPNKVPRSHHKHGRPRCVLVRLREKTETETERDETERERDETEKAM